MVHLYNSGFEPICDATLSLSETAEVEQAWTVEQVRLEPWFGFGVDGYVCVCLSSDPVSPKHQRPLNQTPSTPRRQVDDTNVFEVLWAENGISPDNTRSMSRFVGFVTKGCVAGVDCVRRSCGWWVCVCICMVV